MGLTEEAAAKRGCPGYGGTCDVPECSVCAGEILCGLCHAKQEKQDKLARKLAKQKGLGDAE